MTPFDTWLAGQGSKLAVALEARRDVICDAVSQRLSRAYPTLCFDPDRSDARAFQRLTFEKSPVRFHNVLVAMLRFRTMTMIEREYEWSWRILPRYGVTSEHMLAQVRWYFEAARVHIGFLNGDGPYLAQLETMILGCIEQVTSGPPPSIRTRPESWPRRARM